MPAQHRPSNAQVISLLKRYHCSTPFHAVRAHLMGSIACPWNRSPVDAIGELWGGELPPFDALEDLNHLLDALVNGLWNGLTEHQDPNNPFELTRLRLKPARAAIQDAALLRQQEVEGFIEGMFGPRDELDFPESAHHAVGVLQKVRGILAGIADLLGDPRQPATPNDLQGLSRNLESFTVVLEKEINTVILSCARARRQAQAKLPQTKPAVQ